MRRIIELQAREDGSIWGRAEWNSAGRQLLAERAYVGISPVITHVTITNSGTPGAAVLDFGIPEGEKGEQGEPGIPGPQGDKGDTGSTTAGSGLVTDANDTTLVTTAHTRAVLASGRGRAAGNNGAVIASGGGVGCETASNHFNTIIGSEDCAASQDRATIIASRGVASASGNNLVMGYATGAPSTANRKVEISGGPGNVTISGTLTSSNVFSDFAEMFPNDAPGAIPPGIIVTEEGGKVRPATADDDILGVVSETAVVVAGDTPFTWQGRFLHDEWGRRIMETISDPDHEGPGPAPMIEVQAENPAWDPDRPQVSRRQRPDEWSCVGLLGQVLVRVADTVAPGDRLAAQEGIGVPSPARTGLRCMEIMSPYEAGRGYAIARCLINTMV